MEKLEETSKKKAETSTAAEISRMINTRNQFSDDMKSHNIPNTSLMT